MKRKAIAFFIIILIAFLHHSFLYPEESQEKERTSLFCSQCGVENKLKAKFCKACGTTIIPIDSSRYVKNFKKDKKYLTTEDKQFNLDRASRAVVRVQIKSPVKYREPSLGRRSSRSYYGSESVVVRELELKGVEVAGSGFFVSPDGYIVTNAHVANPFNTEAEIEVEMFNGKKYDAQLVGSDQATDIAVLKTDGDAVEYLEWVEPVRIKVGEELWAIGNPLDMGLTTTKGIMSSTATLRAGFWQIENFLNIDAKITHGNSGGPTVDCLGNVVGVNDIKLGSDEEALNYCISSTVARKAAEDLIDDGKISRSFLGLGLSGLNKETTEKFNIPYKRGVVIEYLVPGSPAEKIGFLPGDLIFEVNDVVTLSTFAVQDEIINLPPGSKVGIKFMRGKDPKMAVITTEARPKMPRISPIEDLERHLEADFRMDADGNVILADIKEFGLAKRVGLEDTIIVQKFFPVEFWEIRDKNWKKISDAKRPIKIDSLDTLAEAISKSYLNEKIAFIIEGKEPDGKVFFPIIIYERPMIIA
jgi:S1-C subfamily serine protease